MKKKIKGIIFDLDGVICFTDKYHYQAWKQIADQLEVPFDEKVNHRLRGVSRMESLEIILERYEGNLPHEQKEKIAEEKNQIYQNLLRKMTLEELPDQVKYTIDKMREKNMLLSVGSSSKNSRLILERLGLEDYFDEVVDGNDIKCSKPNPEVFLKAAERMHLLPEECIVVEDAQAGIQAAIAGGFMNVGIGEAVREVGCTYWIQKIEQLCDIL